MKTTPRSLRLIIVVASLAVLAACGSDDQASPGSTPTPTPVSATHREAEWTIETPASWTKEDITTSADAKKAIRYKASTGEYVIVAIDPLGSDFSSDVIWRYEPKGAGFEIADKAPCGGETCSDKDNRFDGYALWKSGTEPPKVGGHTWYFVFGDTDGTTVDEALFERIIESLRATA